LVFVALTHEQQPKHPTGPELCLWNTHAVPFRHTIASHVQKCLNCFLSVCGWLPQHLERKHGFSA